MRHGQRLRMPAVHLGVRGPVRPCLRNLLLLELGGSRMSLVHGHALGRCWAVSHAARPSVERHPVRIRDRVLPHNRVVDVGVVNDGRIYPCHRSVIRKHSALPHAAHKTNAHIAETVVHSAVIANRRAPVSGVKNVLSARPAPIGRGPQRAHKRRWLPRAGNPVVAIVSVRPVARGPHPTCLGAHRLFEDRKHWRRKCHRDNHARRRQGRQQRNQERHYCQAPHSRESHEKTSRVFRLPAALIFNGL